MPTEEFKQLLERAFSKEAARPITEIASPLLQELVNFALWAFRRCEAEAAETGQENEHVAAFVLFRQIIEMCDGTEVLLSNSCGTAAIPVVRSQFEASLALSYLLESDTQYSQRALCWFCTHIHNAIARRVKLDPGTQQGMTYLDAYEREFTEVARDRTPNAALAAEVGELRAMLTGPQLARIEAEHQRTHAQRRFPEWFALFGGPRNRAELAQILRREAEYLFLYGDFSGVAHGTDMSRYVTGLQGRPAFDAVRRPDELQRLALLSALLTMRAIREMIQRFRNGENLEVWYMRDVQPLWRQLVDLNIEFTPLAE